MGFLLLSVLLAVAVSAIGETNSVELAPRVPRDRFRVLVSNVAEDRVRDEIEDFTNYKCERMVVIRNKAQDAFRLACRSKEDAPKTVTIQPDNAYLFTFRPKKDGSSRFWCTVEYKQQFARFFVYDERLHYMCPRDIEEVHQYTVTHDGVHVDEANDNGGTKIRALFKGHNKFILWETFVNNVTDGYLYSGLVDGGMCSDIPEQFNDKPAAVTMCYNHCVHLYEHFGCTGEVQTVQASGTCVEVEINSNLGGKLSAIKGC